MGFFEGEVRGDLLHHLVVTAPDNVFVASLGQAPPEALDAAVRALQEAGLLGLRKSLGTIQGYDAETVARLRAERKLQAVEVAQKPTEMPLPAAPGVFTYTFDCHPLVQQYFRARARPLSGWRTLHARVSAYLAATCPEWPAGLESLRWLYQSVTHACAAGMPLTAWRRVYVPRIRRGDYYYSTQTLGAFGEDLACISRFFTQRWSRVNGRFRADTQGEILNDTGYRLLAVGRVVDAAPCLAAAMKIRLSIGNTRDAAINASSLSLAHLMLAEFSQAITAAREGVRLADISGDLFQRVTKRATLARCLSLAGADGADATFVKANALHKMLYDEETAHGKPQFPELHSTAGFWLSEHQLAPTYAALWRRRLFSKCPSPEHVRGPTEVLARAGQTLTWSEEQRRAALYRALDHQTIARASLALALIRDDRHLVDAARESFERAEKLMNRAGQQDHIAGLLLAEAEGLALCGESDRAQWLLQRARGFLQGSDYRLLEFDADCIAAGLNCNAARVSRLAKRAREIGYGKWWTAFSKPDGSRLAGPDT